MDDDEEEMPSEDEAIAAINRLYEPDHEGYTKDRRAPFTVQHLMAELHYTYADVAVLAVIEEICEQSDAICERQAASSEGGSGSNEYDYYYLKACEE